MAGDIILAEKNTRSKKVFLVLAVLCLIAVAIASFVIFGKLLRDYIVYDSDRSKAAAEIESIQKQISETQDKYVKQKTEYADRIQKLRDDLKARSDDYMVSLEKIQKAKTLLESEVAQREAKIRDQQSLVDEYLTLSNQVASIKSSAKMALDELKSARESAATEKGTIAALRTEADATKTLLEGLKAQKSSMEKEIDSLADKVSMLNQAQAAVQARTALAKTAFADISIQVSDATNKLNSVETDYARLRNECAKGEATLAGINAKTAVANEALAARITQKDDLDALLKGFSANKATLEGEITGLESRVKQADTTLSRLTAQCKQKQSEFEEAVTTLMEMSPKAIPQVETPTAEAVSTSPSQTKDKAMEAPETVTLSAEKTPEDSHAE